MRPLRIVAYVAAGLIGLIVIGLIFVVVSVDPNNYRDDIQRIVKEKAGRELTLTVSVGWATWEDDDLGQLLARADGALYEAKAAGRNCVRPHADRPT